MRLVKRLSLALAALATMAGALAAPVAAQQTGTLRGTVVEAGTQRPLSAVQVFLPGLGRGAVTNAAGEYSLTAIPAGSHGVRVSRVGYTEATRTVAVAGGQSVTADFTLSASAIALDAIVVTGTPGAATKRSLGNAVAQVNAAEVTEKAPVTNVTQLLQGRAPGLSIAPGAGTAGTAAQITIRGQSTLAAGRQPVFIVDGVRITTLQSGYGVSGQTRSALDFINPDDIESVEVIKGPAAATLYGAEAASGVIQIITKKGKSGQQKVQFSGKIEMGQTDWTRETPTNWTLCTNARIRTSGSGAVGSYPGCAPVDSMQAANSMQRLISHNPLRDDPNTLRSGNLKSYNLSARGGGDRYSFFLSGDLGSEQGVFFNNEAQRRTVRANVDFSPTPELNVSVSTAYGRSYSRLPLNDNASNGLLRNAIRGIAGWKGTYALGWRGLSPAEVNMYDNRTTSDRLVLGATANYRPFDWFRNKLTFGVDHNNALATNFFPIWRQSTPSPYGQDVANGAIYQFTPVSRVYTADYAGTLSRELSADLTGDLSFGAQLNARRSEFTEGQGEGLVSDNVRLVGTANITRAFSGYSAQTSLGFFAQQQLAWRNRLFLTGALRVDDNSAFGEQFSTVLYPKASLAYVISDEPFFSLPGVDNLRLRAAWGQAGNAPEPFSADRTYSGSTVILADGTPVSALRSSAYGNPNLRAETGSEVEVGFESSLWDGRAGVDFTYYNKHTYDALIPIPVAQSSGFGGTRLENSGEIFNSGTELSLWGTPVQTPAFSWDTRVGFATNQNRMVDLGGLETQYLGSFATVQMIKEGRPLGAYFGIDVQRNADGTIVKDALGRGRLSTDTVYVGPSTPTREASLANTLTVLGNLRFYAFADYKGGHYMWNAGNFIRNQQDLNAFEVVNPQADPEDVALRRSGSALPFITRADFVKLREVSVSYTLPRSLSRSVGSDEVSLMLAGRNLALWTNYDGMDPEVNFSGIANTAGFGSVLRTDYMSVPSLRQLVATLNIRF